MRIISLILIALAYIGRAYAGLVIVKDGRTQAVIVTAEKPSASAQHAAEELQLFIELMTGAKLPIQTDILPVPAGQIAMLTGQSKLTAGMSLPTGDNRDHSCEGFILKTQGS